MNRSRRLTAAQLEEFKRLVAKDMQLRAERSQPTAQRSITRSRTFRPRQNSSVSLRRRRMHK